MLSEHASLWSPYIDCVSCCHRIPVCNDHQVHPPGSLQGKATRQPVRLAACASDAMVAGSAAGSPEAGSPQQAICIHARQLALDSCACLHSSATRGDQPLAECQPLWSTPTVVKETTDALPGSESQVALSLVQPLGQAAGSSVGQGKSGSIRDWPDRSSAAGRGPQAVTAWVLLGICITATRRNPCPTCGRQPGVCASAQVALAAQGSDEAVSGGHLGSAGHAGSTAVGKHC